MIIKTTIPTNNTPITIPVTKAMLILEFDARFEVEIAVEFIGIGDVFEVVRRSEVEIAVGFIGIGDVFEVVGRSV